MKKIFVIFLLGLVVSGALQLLAQTSQPSPTPTNQKVIQDPAEYNSYIAALNTQDPASKAAAFEAFITQYPNSIVKIDALEQAMAAYQQAGNSEKVQSIARRLLEINSNNVRALAIIAYLDRAKATAGDQPSLKEACDFAQKGQQALSAWQKPEATSDDEFGKLRNQMSGIFYGVSGFCALQAKDYVTARTNYLKSFQIDPANLQDVYQLGLSCSLMNPMDVSGLWYLAKAINIANAQNNAKAAQGIAVYAKAKYQNYHGSEEGWDQLVAAVANQAVPPAVLSDAIKPKPSDCDIAAKAVAENKPEDLSFSDKEFILAQRDCGSQGKDAADKVWQSIQSMQKNGQAMLRIPVMVISATANSLEVAITDENQQAKKADMHVTMLKPMPAAPAAGFMTDVIGVITSYTPKPFLFTMEKGSLPAPDAGTSK